MTKIMTVYAAFDRIRNTNLSITNKCRISPRAYKMRGSRTFLEIDDSVSIDDLLKGIIIQSGNDACIVIAEGLSGTEENMVDEMNEKAVEIGLTNSNFQNVAIVKFQDLFPVGLTSLEFDATETDINYFTAEAVMRYTVYNIFDKDGFNRL